MVRIMTTRYLPIYTTSPLLTIPPNRNYTECDEDSREGIDKTINLSE